VKSFVFERPPKNLIFARVRRETRETCDSRRIKITPKNWNELMANPGARPGCILVGRVLAPRLPQISEKLTQFGAPYFKKGANDSSRYRIDSRQTRKASASQQMRQDGFRLIVGGVSHCDSIQVAGHSAAREKLVTQAPGCVFKIPVLALSFASHIGPAKFTVELKFRRERFHKSLVFVRVRSPKLVVEMQYDNCDPELGAQFRENPEHRHGIGSARNAQADSVAGPDHSVAPDGFADSLVQSGVHLK